jgi:hypothetical protein
MSRRSGGGTLFQDGSKWAPTLMLLMCTIAVGIKRGKHTKPTNLDDKRAWIEKEKRWDSHRDRQKSFNSIKASLLLLPQVYANDREIRRHERRCCLETDWTDSGGRNCEVVQVRISLCATVDLVAVRKASD